VAVASDGTLYVADSWNHRIRRIAADGTVSTLAGAATPGTDDGTGSTALFDHPSAIALGPAGALYVADEFAHTIRQVTVAGGVTTLAGDGYSKGHADGTGGAARLTFPAGLAVGPDGTVYVSEKDACYLRRITAGGVVSTLNDRSAYRCGFGDGDVREARVNNAIGLAVAADGSLLIADTYNGDIRRIRFDQAGNEVSTYAGADPGYRNGSRALSRFEGPQAVVEDDHGVLYVADAHSIRRIQP
jgi:sugar lactone lactonase YvrE